MNYDEIPLPTIMPVNSEAWAKELNLCNFVNSYYQYRDLQRFEHCKKVLIVGPGQGLDAYILKWRGFEVTTLDIDNAFEPDFVGSVHQMDIFSDDCFDAIIASHVLEHLAEAYLDSALSEIARVGRYALIYLPVHGRHLQLRLKPGFKGFDWSLVLDLYNYFHKPDGLTPRYMANQHFWEVGMKGFRVKNILKRMSDFFEVISWYRNKDWIASVNFLLKSKR